MHGNDVLPPASVALRDTCDSYACAGKSACSRVGPTGPLSWEFSAERSSVTGRNVAQDSAMICSISSRRSFAEPSIGCSRTRSVCSSCACRSHRSVYTTWASSRHDRPCSQGAGGRALVVRMSRPHQVDRVHADALAARQPARQPPPVARLRHGRSLCKSQSAWPADPAIVARPVRCTKHDSG